MNIYDLSAIRPCTSCQMCAAVCSKNAIKIELNAEGFYQPIIDNTICFDCGLCTKVCYKFDEKIEDFGKDKLATTKLYGAFAKETAVIEQTTSGGIADLLARELLNEGYKCVGVVYDSKTDCAKSIIATKDEELLDFRGSKYIQSYTLDSFKKIVKTCTNTKYAVFGTPCHIYALDKFLCQLKVRNRFMLIDLYCHGCPTMHIWKKYINDIKKKIAQPKIDNVNFRSKIKGWGSFYVVAVVDGSPVYYSNYKNNAFFDLFFADQVLNESCNKCLLRGTLAYTDIRLGDFWGKQYVLNHGGVSAVSLVSDKGKTLFEKIAGKINFREEQYEDFLPWQSWGKEYHPDPKLRKILIEQLQDKSIPLRESVLTIHRQQNIKQKLIRYAKNLLHSMPVDWEKRIRWIFYKL